MARRCSGPRPLRDSHLRSPRRSRCGHRRNRDRERERAPSAWLRGRRRARPGTGARARAGSRPRALRSRSRRRAAARGRRACRGRRSPSRRRGSRRGARAAHDRSGDRDGPPRRRSPPLESRGCRRSAEVVELESSPAPPTAFAPRGADRRTSRGSPAPLLPGGAGPFDRQPRASGRCSRGGSAMRRSRLVAPLPRAAAGCLRRSARARNRSDRCAFRWP